MADDNLIIVDDEYTAVADRYVTLTNLFEEQLNKYIRALDEIKANKIIQGQVADNLSALASATKSMLNNQLAYIMKYQARQMKDYISTIDATDKYLY
jgi:hypothetical protein